MRIAVAVVLLMGLAAAVASGQEESPFKPAGTVTFEPVNEMSGIAKSNTYEDVYWVLNDSGDTARLFAINGKGEIIKPPYLDEDQPWPGLEVLVAANVDWEDLTIDGDMLYIADTGNNGNARRDLGVYALPEPNPRATERVRPLKFIPVRYPEQDAYPGNLWQFDCEAVFASDGKLYFVTKHRVPGVFNSGEWGARLYRLDSTHSGRVNDLTLIDSRPDLALPTAAEVSPDGTKLALLTALALHVFEKPDGSDHWLSGAERFISLDQDITRQAEAVCWDDDETIRITNEQRQIFTISLDALGEPPTLPTVTQVGKARIPKSYELAGLRFSPSGSHLLVAHSIKEEDRGWGWTGFELFITAKDKKSRKFKVKTTGSALPAFSRNGRYLAFGEPAGPQSIKIHLVDLGGRPDIEWVVPVREGQTLPTVQAVSDDGTLVAIEEPEGADRRGSLLVWSLPEEKAVSRLADYQEPYKGQLIPGAELAGGWVFYHMREVGRAGGGDYRLIARRLDGNRSLAFPGWVSASTPGYLVSRNARWIVHGGANYDITRSWLDGGIGGESSEVLFHCHEQLYSHWLELTTSANEWMIVAWSSERRVLCCYDTVRRERFDVAIPESTGRTLLGLSPNGRFAYLTGGPAKTRAIEVLDLWRRTPIGKLLDIPHARPLLDPTGRFLATLTEDGKEWQVRIYRLR